MVKTALAVCGEVMAPSLGTAGEFVIISGNAVERCLRTGKLLHFLQEQQIDVVICNGIGNCTAAMLAALGIAVIPGKGNDDDIGIERSHIAIEAVESFAGIITAVTGIDQVEFSAVPRKDADFENIAPVAARHVAFGVGCAENHHPEIIF